MKNLVLFLMLFAFYKANSQHKAGTIDSSFGTNGKTITILPEGFSHSYASALQNDDKIIVAGEGRIGDLAGIIVMRYTKDGMLDSSFGNEGILIIDLGINYQERANAIAVQPDNKIIITGYRVIGFFENTNYDIPVIRLQPDGAFDSSFGNNGVAIADYDDRDVAYDMAMQTDGKIVVEGVSSGRFITLRLKPDGSPDESFGSGGKVLTSIGLSSGAAVAIQPDGKIIATGTEETRMLTIRYLPNGTPDNSFGINGEVRTNYNQFYEFPSDILIQPDGKIITAGRLSRIFDDTTMLVRYNPDGSLDSAFGKNGIALSKLLFVSNAKKAVLQDDGRVITAGFAYDNKTTFTSFLILRFDNNGAIDTSFGTNGYVTSQFLDGSVAYGMLIQKNNKIVLTGDALDEEGRSSAALARYFNDAAPPPTPIARIKRWLRKHGITWEDCPPSICTNISGYAVQRSPNGINWSTIFRSPLTAHRSLLTNSYADPSPLPGTNYYRLQTTSVDGAVAYSNVIAISNELSVMSISPNPARSILRIEGLPANQKIKITVVDLAGNVAMNYEPLAIRPSSLNISSLRPGNYLLRIETEGEVVTRQFVKE